MTKVQIGGVGGGVLRNLGMKLNSFNFTGLFFLRTDHKPHHLQVVGNAFRLGSPRRGWDKAFISKFELETFVISNKDHTIELST
jgi:hypothetical protein